MRNFFRRRTGPPDDSQVTITALNTVQFREHLPEAIAIWADAMGYRPSLIASRMTLAIGHLEQPHLRAVIARSGSGALIGFAYGYQSKPGQWWHDEIERLASKAGAAELLTWMGNCFELCELHVAPQAQGQGTGRLVLEKFLRIAPIQRVILSTPHGPTRAIALYEKVGFRRLGSDFYFANDTRPFAIYGYESRLQEQNRTAPGE